MGVATTQIIYGNYDSYDGGLYNIHQAFLYENDRPIWKYVILGNGNIKRYSWVPSEVKTIFEDSLLMFSIFKLKNEKIIELLNKELKGNVFETGVIILYEAISNEKLQIIRNEVKKIEFPGKLRICFLGRTTVKDQIDILNEYKVKYKIYE